MSQTLCTIVTEVREEAETPTSVPTPAHDPVVTFMVTHIITIMKVPSETVLK